ncbi:MAG: hypothetical protein ACXVJE_19340 [Mucilaginibacter sp.]
MLKKYFDEKMILSLIVAGVALWFLQHYFSKKMIKDGKVSHYVGNDAVGYQEI